MRTSICQSTAW